MRNKKIWSKEFGVWQRKYIETPEITSERFPLASASRLSEQKAAAFYNAGWEIHDGNNPYMDQKKKWENHFVVRIRATNSTSHGHCINTTFAVKEA